MKKRKKKIEENENSFEENEENEDSFDKEKNEVKLINNNNLFPINSGENNKEINVNEIIKDIKQKENDKKKQKEKEKPKDEIEFE